jgi:hypothetical protein
MMKKIARENTKKFIKKYGKRGIVGAVFIKKDGATRTMSFRVDVKKNLKGGENKVERLDRPYLTVFDMQKNEYRTINLRTLKNITVDGVTYEVV